MSKSNHKGTKGKARKAALIAALPAELSGSKQFKHYVREAEHTDGIAYWENFANADELLADIRQYNGALADISKEDVIPHVPERSEPEVVKPSSAAPTAAGPMRPTSNTRPLTDTNRIPGGNDAPRQPYRLGTSDRIEMLTDVQARVRNRCRNDNQKWTVDHNVDPATVPVPNPIETDTEVRNKLSLEGRRKDAAAMGKKNSKQENTDEKSAKKEKADRIAPGRHEWKGQGMCEMLRLLGSLKASKPVARKVMEKLGFTPGNSTVHIQMGKGAAGENVPNLDKEDLAHVKELAAGFAEEEPAPKGKSGKKVKAKGKSGKESVAKGSDKPARAKVGGKKKKSAEAAPADKSAKEPEAERATVND